MCRWTYGAHPQSLTTTSQMTKGPFTGYVAIFSSFRHLLKKYTV